MRSSTLKLPVNKKPITETPAATSDPHEKLVACDVTELQPPPFPSNGFIMLTGASEAQIAFAKKVRYDKFPEWKHDLPDNVASAVRGIADSTWWLANKDHDTANIGWPTSWTTGLRNRASSLDSQPTLNLADSREKVANGFEGTMPPTQKRNEALNEFEAFARKVCQSPELSYLAMMAMMYRHGRDPTILAKFKEAREKIQGHLDAIDKIVGTT